MDATEPDSSNLEGSLFGITRKEWSEDVTPEDRVELALSVQGVEIKLEGTEKAVVETNKGNFLFELYSVDAPNTVSNFVRLAESGFYDGLIWHRYEPGFVIQGGDPTGTGRGNSGYRIDFEHNPKTHEEGAVGMARGENINSASCQFYICLEQKDQLNGRYCVFGRIIEGMEIVRELRAEDSILRVSITR